MSGRCNTMAEVIRFIKKADSRGLCFGGWPESILEIYLQWHHQNGGLVIVKEGGDVVALAVGTKLHESDLDKHWVPWRENGDSMYLADIVASKKQAVAACLNELAEKCPNWKELKLFANRHGKRHQFRPEAIERMIEAWS